MTGASERGSKERARKVCKGWEEVGWPVGRSGGDEKVEGNGIGGMALFA